MPPILRDGTRDDIPRCLQCPCLRLRFYHEANAIRGYLDEETPVIVIAGDSYLMTRDV